MIKKDTSLESLESAMMTVSVHHHEDNTAITDAKAASRQDSNNSPSTVFSDVTNECPEGSSAPSPSSKRFFVIDWLEQLNEEEMEKARRIAQNKNLMTPQKIKKSSSRLSPEEQHELEQQEQQQQAPSSPTHNNSTRINNNHVMQTPPRHASSSPPTTPPPSSSSFFSIVPNTPWRKQSIAIGNGWNAKGLDKAKQDKWDDALACWEKAFHIRVQVLGDEHKDVANTLNNMGIALGRLDRYEEAMEKLESCLKVRTSLLCNNNSSTTVCSTMEIAGTLHNIGNLFQQMDDYPNALRCFLETKRIQTRLLGETHLQVARTTAAIGHLHFEQSHFKLSLASYQEARDVFWQVQSLDEWKQTKLDIQEVEELILEEEEQQQGNGDNNNK
eukprot:CAMPEP_0194040066 /NCGR_PEP_ID=MMETSP0009_2-20130614/12124_1 /TAXON_ID=210454 /ORGANISM="Grammatophora oceanica, Strain CCMP 410" /LENGTH=385 /DNA_ID=CAMNT_0038683089 /DNA_START=60 /DNA_END=1217 /DNA_ORIENTATION=+